MAVFTEHDLGQHPQTLIDAALATTTGRDLIPASEVQDLLLEVRTAMARWDDVGLPES